MSTKTIDKNLPKVALEGSLSSYLTQIKKFPILTAKEEYMLAKNWKQRGDFKSAQKLITSHLRLVAKIAMGYKGYGLPVGELVSIFLRFLYFFLYLPSPIILLPKYVM